MMFVSADDIFKNFDRIYGIHCEESACGKSVFTLSEEDMMFWGKVYNLLDVDKDYDFFVSVWKENNVEWRHQATFHIPEISFVEIMETLYELKNWKNNRFGIELEQNQNKRIHKLIQKMNVKINPSVRFA